MVRSTIAFLNGNTFDLNMSGMMGIYDDRFIPQYRKLTDMVHWYGPSIMMQIAYGGTKTTYETDGRIIFAQGDIFEFNKFFMIGVK